MQHYMILCLCIVFFQTFYMSEAEKAAKHTHKDSYKDELNETGWENLAHKYLKEYNVVDNIATSINEKIKKRSKVSNSDRKTSPQKLTCSERFQYCMKKHLPLTSDPSKDILFQTFVPQYLPTLFKVTFQRLQQHFVDEVEFYGEDSLGEACENKDEFLNCFQQQQVAGQSSQQTEQFCYIFKASASFLKGAIDYICEDGFEKYTTAKHGCIREYLNLESLPDSANWCLPKHFERFRNEIIASVLLVPLFINAEFGATLTDYRGISSYHDLKLPIMSVVCLTEDLVVCAIKDLKFWCKDSVAGEVLHETWLSGAKAFLSYWSFRGLNTKQYSCDKVQLSFQDYAKDSDTRGNILKSATKTLKQNAKSNKECDITSELEYLAFCASEELYSFVLKIAQKPKDITQALDNYCQSCNFHKCLSAYQKKCPGIGYSNIVLDFVLDTCIVSIQILHSNCTLNAMKSIIEGYFPLKLSKNCRQTFESIQQYLTEAIRVTPPEFQEKTLEILIQIITQNPNADPVVCLQKLSKRFTKTLGEQCGMKLGKAIGEMVDNIHTNWGVLKLKLTDILRAYAMNL